jgi:hypothetical protein
MNLSYFYQTQAPYTGSSDSKQLNEKYNQSESEKESEN